MAGKIGRLRTGIRQAGRSENAVTISFTGPIAFTRPSRSSRPLLSGHPEGIAADLRQYQELGVSNFIFNLPGASVSEKQEVMERITREVMPLFSRE